MNQSELLDRLANAEWDVSRGARLLVGQRNAVRQLRTCMRDVTSAEALLTDLECAQVLSVSERDRLRTQVEHLHTTDR